MRKGDIVLVPFPFTDLSGQKVRPCLVLFSYKKGDDCIVAFISSIEKRKTAFNVPVEPSQKNGLKLNSIIKIDKIATLQKRIALGKIGEIDADVIDEIDRKLKLLFKL